MKHKPVSAKRVVVTSFVVDLSDLILSLAVAILSGSVVMISQALQGAADLTTSVLLLVGVSRSRRRPNKRHRMGYGRELFFWILMGGISMFVLTAGLSVYLGMQRFLHPEPIGNLYLAYGVLFVGLATNLYALSLSMRRLGVHRQSVRNVMRHMSMSSMIETKATLVLDTMGSLASLLGLAALVIYQATGDARYDGIGAIVVGLSVGGLSIGLILEVRDLIVGRSASPEVEKQIAEVAEEVEGVIETLDVISLLIGSEKVAVNIDVHLAQHLTTPAIEQIIDEVKKKVKRRVPEVSQVQVEVETPVG